MLFAALAFVWRYGYRVPHADDFLATVPVLLGEQPVTASWFWSFQGDDRIPLPKLILLAMYKLTGWNFHAATFLNPLVLAGLAFALIQATKRLRGWISYSDALFPLTLLPCAPGGNFLWSLMIQYHAWAVLMGTLLLIIIRDDKSLRLETLLLAGICVLLLPTCGAIGVGPVPALALWLGYVGVSKWFSAEHARKRNGVVILAFAGAAIVLAGLYFVGFRPDREQYTPPPRWLDKYGSLWQDAPKYIPPSSSLRATLKASAQFLSMGFAAHTFQSYWKYCVLGELCLLLISAAILVLVWCQRPRERCRASGLLLYLGSVVSLAVSIGYGRAAGGDLFDQARYAILAVPVVWCLYYVWEIYGPGPLRRFLPLGLFILIGLPLPLLVLKQARFLRA
jgi:hypothetical protein